MKISAREEGECASALLADLAVVATGQKNYLLGYLLGQSIDEICWSVDPSDERIGDMLADELELLVPDFGILTRPARSCASQEAATKVVGTKRRKAVKRQKLVSH